MKQDNFDKVIKDHLMKETNDASEMKDSTWENIDQALFTNTEAKVKNKRTKFIVKFLTMVALIAILFTGLTTKPGQALIQTLKEMFIEEKDIEIEIEGDHEDIHVKLEANEEIRYIIYVDTSRYKLIEGTGSDMIIPGEPLGDQYPKVSMEIKRDSDSIEEAVRKIKQEIEALDSEIVGEEDVTTPVEGKMIRAVQKGPSSWDTPVYKYYVTNELNEQVYIIKQTYFLEAAEGHGVRFDAMLESFQVVSEPIE